MDITGKYLLVVHDYCVTSDCVFIPVSTVSNLIILGGAPLLLYLHIILVRRSHSFPSDPGLVYLGQVPYLLGHHHSSKDKHMTLIVLSSWDSCCKDLEQEHTTVRAIVRTGSIHCNCERAVCKGSQSMKRDPRNTLLIWRPQVPGVKPRLESPSEFSFAQGTLSTFNRKISTSDTCRAWQSDKYIPDTKYKEGYFRFLKIVFTTVCLCGIMWK